MKQNSKRQAGAKADSSRSKPLVSRRLSSYDKMKQENAKLKQDIYNLVRNADKIEGTQTRVRYEMQYKMNDAVWFGDATKSPTQFSGILGCLSNGG